MPKALEQDSASVLVPPPLIVLAGILAASGLGRTRPWTLPPNELWAFAGWGLILFGCGICLWGLTQMLRAGTAVNPARPTTTLVRLGPYRWSRNPLYLALLLIQGGIALTTGNLWILMAILPVWGVLRWGVIAREERYLEAKFGEAYRQYCQEVRRWI